MRFGPEPTHTIAHLSDPHLLADGRLLHAAVDVTDNLRRTLAQVERTGRRIDALVFTGDLTDLGEPEAYALLRDVVGECAARLGCEVVWVIGNHDERAPYACGLFDVETVAGQLQPPQDRVYDLRGLRVIALDSTVDGYHHGGLDPDQIAWLRNELAQPAEHGSLLALHHPPLASAVDLMNVIGLDDQDEFADAIAGTDVRGILAGHLHHSSHGTFAGVPVSVAAASCYSLDGGAPDGTLIGVDGRQGFDLVDVHPHGLVHTHIPLGSPPVISGFGVEVEDALAALDPVARREAFSSKSSTWKPPAQ